MRVAAIFQDASGWSSVIILYRAGVGKVASVRSSCPLISFANSIPFTLTVKRQDYADRCTFTAREFV